MNRQNFISGSELLTGSALLGVSPGINAQFFFQEKN